MNACSRGLMRLRITSSPSRDRVPESISPITRAIFFARPTSSSSWGTMRSRKTVSRASMSRVVEICAEAMFAPVAAQAPANNMRSFGLSLVTSVSSVSDRNAVASDGIRHGLPIGFERPDQPCVLHLPVKIGPEPVVRFISFDEALDFIGRPCGERLSEPGLSRANRACRGCLVRPPASKGSVSNRASAGADPSIRSRYRARQRGYRQR